MSTLYDNIYYGKHLHRIHSMLLWFFHICFVYTTRKTEEVVYIRHVYRFGRYYQWALWEIKHLTSDIMLTFCCPHCCSGSQGSVKSMDLAVQLLNLKSHLTGFIECAKLVISSYLLTECSVNWMFSQNVQRTKRGTLLLI